MPAISWAVAPRKSVHGIIRDLAALDANLRSVDARTRAAIASPMRPNGAGSAAKIGRDFTVVSDLIVSFSVMLITYFANQYITDGFIRIAKNKKRNRYFDIST